MSRVISAVMHPRRAAAALDRRIQAFRDPDRTTFRQFKAALKGIPRYQPGEVLARNWHLSYTDAASLLSAFESIVVRRWNDFSSASVAPLILDCGANIGIAAIHYKRLFPKSRVIAFEPDARSCIALRRNLEMNGAGDVEVVEAAVWAEKGDCRFFSEGADANRIVGENEDLGMVKKLTQVGQVCRIPTVRLSDYLKREYVDCIKLDIEGVEADVIAECAPHLSNVESLIIEFHLTNSRPHGLGSMLSILADKGFSVSVASYGPWVDLTHKTAGLPNSKIEFDQYLLICCWRPDAKSRSSVTVGN